MRPKLSAVVAFLWLPMYASEPGLGRHRPEVVALKRARGGWEQEAQKQQLLFFIARLVSTVDHDTDQSPWAWHGRQVCTGCCTSRRFFTPRPPRRG
jgi:hypothetical protein